ncbi:MAG TPA: glycosyltransferase [Polyangiales bacterium]|nr:glycosyltransferase [Polyangiales bacterium]
MIGMRVLVVADGTRGDVQPMTVLALQLLHEGQTVTFAGPPSFREFVESKGLVFTPLPFDTEAVIKANPKLATGGVTGLLVGAPKLFVQTSEGQLQVLPQLAKQADFILVGGVHAGVPSAAEYAGIPWRWVLYTSILYPSNAHPPLTAGLGRAPRAVNWLLWQLTQKYINFLFRDMLNSHRERLALPPLDDVSQHILCPHPILAMEPELAPLPPEWPDADHIGYLDPGEGAPLSDELEAFLERGPAPVYIGFGSMPDDDPRATTQLFAEATRRAGVRAVISRGWADFGSDLPEHCMAVGPVSHPRLFPRVAAIVHHGGAGTTAASARAGKPQLIVPHIADQFYFGHRVQELGVGVTPLRRTQLRTAALAERLRTLVGDASMRERAAKLGETIRARPRPENLSRLLVQRAGASLPVLPLGRGISIMPPPK